VDPKVTPAMVEAGLDAYASSNPRFCLPEEIVTRVFLAMYAVSNKEADLTRPELTDSVRSADSDRLRR